MKELTYIGPYDSIVVPNLDLDHPQTRTKLIGNSGVHVETVYQDQAIEVARFASALFPDHLAKALLEQPSNWQLTKYQGATPNNA